MSADDLKLFFFKCAMFNLNRPKHNHTEKEPFLVFFCKKNSTFLKSVLKTVVFNVGR